jgi:hypothetical protein
MSTNPLNDISKVYLEQVVESAVPGKPAERLGAVTLIPKAEQEAARERALAKAKAMREKKGIKTEALDRKVGGGVKKGGGYERGYATMQKEIEKLDKGEEPATAKRYKEMRKEALDPVGKEDKDIDNDGDHDKTDKYLLNRRKVRGAAIAKKSVKEGYSNWREELSEVAEYISKDKGDEKITEKKVKNKIKINPNMGEAVENLGGTLLEMVEIDEMDYILESVYDELLEEGYDEDDIEEALEYSLTEAKVTFGHDTATPEKKRGSLLAAAKQKLASKVAGAKKAAKQAVASGARKVAKGALGVARKIEGGDKKPSTAERKPSTYRGAGAGTKERVSSGSYTPPTKKKAEKPADPWEGTASTPPKAKPKATTKKAAAPKAKPTAAPKRKRKASKLDSLLTSIRNEEVQQIDELSVNKMLAYTKKAEKDRERLNKKWDQGTATPKERKKVFDREEGEARASDKIEKKTGKRPYEMNAIDKLRAAATRSEEVQINEMPYQVMGSPDGGKEKKIGKPVKSKKYADARAAELADTHKATGGKYRSQYVENVEQIDEKTLTTAETRKKEELVKKMKKSAADFEKRYPGRGKEVMYATATKMAKRMAEQALEMQPKTSSTEKPDQQQKKTQQQQDRMRQQEVQILQRKLQALRSAPKGTDPSITAGYEPEGEMIDERRKEDKVAGTPRKPRNRAFELVAKSMGTGRMGVQPRGQKKEKGKKPPAAGEYGAPASPAQKVAKRRASAQRAQDNMSSRFD